MAFTRSNKKGSGGNAHYWDFDQRGTMTCYVSQDANHPAGALNTSTGEISVSDTQGNWSWGKFFRTNIPTGATKMKVHFDSLSLTNYGGFTVVPSNVNKSGVSQSGDDTLLNATRCYIKTGQSGAVSETDYEITIDFSSMSDRTYIYFGLTTGCSQSQTSGYNNGWNGSGSCKIAWIDFE